MAFEAGCDQVQGAKQIFLPWYRFNQHASAYYESSLEAYQMAQEFHPAWPSLSPSVRRLMARNSHQLFGADMRSPVKMVICYTPQGSGTGGTGQALRIARAYDIPIIDLGGMTVQQAQEAINGRILELGA